MNEKSENISQLSSAVFIKYRTAPLSVSLSLSGASAARACVTVNFVIGVRYDLLNVANQRGEIADN